MFSLSRTARSQRWVKLSVVWFVAFATIATFASNVLLLWRLDTTNPQRLDNQSLPRHLRRPSSATNFRGQGLERLLLPASVWATRQFPDPQRRRDQLVTNVSSLLTTKEKDKALKLCGKFLYSTLGRAVHAKSMAHDVFVATGDIDSMWVRDSVVQMTIYLRQMESLPWLRFVIEGTIRRNAFNILQDPYANAYEHHWKDPARLPVRDQVIGRGGFVATRNYELDSGAYFLCHLYDYFMTNQIYRPEILLQEPIIFEAVMTMVNTWIVEQNHDEQSPYRYYELPNQGKGTPTNYTGMTWSGFRPSDDACKYGYLVPANIHAAAALQRILLLNDRIWQDDTLTQKASKLLMEIEEGIDKFGIVYSKSGEPMYAYEVDGRGNSLQKFDDANVPSLLSIPLLGWDGYNQEAYNNTRKYLLSSSNKQFFHGKIFQGIGSPHTPSSYIWPMAMVIQGLTETGPDQAEKMAFQMRQLLKSATNDAMHESVHKDHPTAVTRQWFEWANALFVIYTETVLGTSCAHIASDLHRQTHVEDLMKKNGNHTAGSFYKVNRKNDHWDPTLYQNIEAYIHSEG